MRAEPKNEAAAPTWASASKPWSISAWMRSIRAASVSVETTAVSCAAMISSSSVAGMRGSGPDLSMAPSLVSAVRSYGARKASVLTPARASAAGSRRANGWSSALSSRGLAITKPTVAPSRLAL